MKEFIIDLYKNPNFPMYCGIAIAVLASLFILIYVIGKKDKKKFDETQALKLQELQAKEAENNMTVAKLDNSAPVEPVNIAPVQEEPAIPRLENVPINTVPLPDTTPSVPEVVPVINPDDIPATPEYAMPQAVNNTIDEEAYKSNDNEINEIKEVVPKFEMEPNIEPVIPENTIEQMRNLNNELNNEITELEQVVAPNVAPVEVLADTLDVTPPAPAVQPTVSVEPVQANAAPVASPAPVQPRPQIFSAVNVPKPAAVEPISMPVNNIDEIDSL